MENQHRQIKGYRELTQPEIDLMNRIKEQGEQLRSLIKELQATPSLDQRSVSIAQTNLQTGVMWAVRSVAQPESF